MNKLEKEVLEKFVNNAKELSECLDVMPKDIKELKKIGYNIALDMMMFMLEQKEWNNFKKQMDNKTIKLNIIDYLTKICWTEKDIEYFLKRINIPSSSRVIKIEDLTKDV